MNRHLEFRVLSGCHAGAVAPMHDSVLVGGGLSCDIVLADEGMPDMPVSVCLEDAGFSVDGGEHLASNVPWKLGSVWVTVAAQGQSWPALPVLSADEELLSDAQGLPGNEQVSGNEETLVSEKSASHTTGPRYGVAYATTTALLAFGLVTAILVAWRPGFGSVDEVEATRSAPFNSPMVGQVAKIRLILEGLGQYQVQVLLQKNGPIVLRGWVSTSSERDAVAEAMTRVWPMPALQLYIRDEVLNTVRPILEKSLMYGQMKVHDGTLHIEGVASDQTHKEKALSSVAARYPDMPVVSGRLLLSRTVNESVIQALRAQGVTGLTPLWEDGYMQLDVRGESAARQKTVRKVANLMNDEYWQRVKVLGPEDPAQVLPFAIRSVVGGPEPYVVLANGIKLLTGGTYQGFRLTSIEADRLVFHGSQELVVRR